MRGRRDCLQVALFWRNIARDPATQEIRRAGARRQVRAWLANARRAAA